MKVLCLSDLHQRPNDIVGAIRQRRFTPFHAAHPRCGFGVPAVIEIPKDSLAEVNPCDSL
jgi:hypothetical protein